MLIASHETEWTEKSAASVEIARLNVETLTDAKTIADRINWAKWTNGQGWWVTGVDPATGKRTGLGGQFKPDNPIENDKGKPQKYLSIKKAKLSPLFLEMPGDSEYWAKVLADPLHPIILTEGAKKAGAGLTAGYATISLPGVEAGQKHDRLHAWLQLFCQLGRPIYLAFDQDLLVNPNVRRALDRLARLLCGEGCNPHLLLWDASKKGLDDLLVADGVEALSIALSNAPTYREWQESRNEQARREQREQAGRSGYSKDGKKIELTFYQEMLRDLYRQEKDYWICVDGKFYQWTGSYYKLSSLENETQRVYDYCNEYKVETEDKVTHPYAHPQYISKSITWAKAALGVSTELINPPGLNCTNGVLELEWLEDKPTWELKPHSPDRYYIYEPQVKYDPNADPTSCDQLLQCLEPAEQAIFLRLIASSLDLERIRAFRGRYIKALLLKGDGSNGKDALREVVSLMYGRQGMTSLTLMDFVQYDGGRKFAVNKARHARISWSSENHTIKAVDKTQCLKAFVTGDEVSFEAKGLEEIIDEPKTVLLFNCNETPDFTGALEAIRSRFAILSFNKTFKIGANPKKGEIEADPRFRYDTNFLRTQVLPSFLNRVLQALTDLMAYGIDYDPTNQAMEDVQSENNHLYQFCREIGLKYGTDRLYAKQIWDKLEQWYIDNGTLILEPGSSKRNWNEQVKKSDKNVKGVNQIIQRFLELFPKAKRGSNRDGVYIEGLTFNVEEEDNVQPEHLAASCEAIASPCEDAAKQDVKLQAPTRKDREAIELKNGGRRESQKDEKTGDFDRVEALVDCVPLPGDYANNVNAKECDNSHAKTENFLEGQKTPQNGLTASQANNDNGYSFTNISTLSSQNEAIAPPQNTEEVNDEDDLDEDEDGDENFVF